MIKTMIIDDQLACEDLKKKLEPFSNIRIVGEVFNLCHAVSLIQDKLPDLLFINIDMPEKSGFHLVEILRKKLIQIPFLIFTTQHAEFTLQALRNGAIDYLQKPINEAELAEAVGRAVVIIQRNNHQQKVDRLIDYISNYKQLFFPFPTGYKAINISNIVYIYKKTNDSRITVVLGESDEFILPPNYSLLDLANILPRFDFFKIKRDLIINLKYLVEVELHTKTCKLKKGSFEVTVEISKRCLKEFREKMVV